MQIISTLLDRRGFLWHLGCSDSVVWEALCFDSSDGKQSTSKSYCFGEDAPSDEERGIGWGFEWEPINDGKATPALCWSSKILRKYSPFCSKLSWRAFWSCRSQNKSTVEMKNKPNQSTSHGSKQFEEINLELFMKYFLNFDLYAQSFCDMHCPATQPSLAWGKHFKGVGANCAFGLPFYRRLPLISLCSYLPFFRAGSLLVFEKWQHCNL